MWSFPAHVQPDPGAVQEPHASSQSQRSQPKGAQQLQTAKDSFDEGPVETGPCPPVAPGELFTAACLWT